MYRITKTDQLTSKKEVVEIYTDRNESANKSQANMDLMDIRSQYVDSILSPIISNEKGLSFAVSRTGLHLIYQVEQFDPHFDELSEIFNPNFNPQMN